MRHAESLDPAGVAFLREPGELLLPRLQVVDLLDLDPAEPVELPRELLAPLVDAAGPDLGRDDRLLTLWRNCSCERPFRAAIHRRRVEEPVARVECGTHDGSCRRRVAVKGVPRPEADDRPQSACLHQASLARAARPAAKATAKKSGSSEGVLPMCESDSSAQAASQPVTS